MTDKWDLDKWLKTFWGNPPVYQVRIMGKWLTVGYPVYRLARTLRLSCKMTVFRP